MKKTIVCFMLIVVTILATAALAGRFSVSFLTSAVITAPAAQPYIDIGKFYLTSRNILAARDQFKLAVETEPANQEANFLYGISRIAAVAEDGQDLDTTGLDSVREIFELAGIVFSKFSIYGSTYSKITHYTFPATTPRTVKVLEFLKAKFLPEVEGAIANLETVSSTAFTSTHNPAAFGKPSGAILTADYADALIVKALLHALKCSLELVLVYGPDVYIPNIQSAPAELMTYKQLFQNPTFLTPKESARLETARVSLINFIDTYFLASQFLLARSGLAHHLFVIDVPLTNEIVTAESLSLNDFKKALSEVKASLNGPYLSSYAPDLEPNYRFIDLSKFFNAANPINLRQQLVNCSTGVVFPDPTVNGLFPLGLTGYEPLVTAYGADVLGVVCMGRETPLISVSPDSVMAFEYLPSDPVFISNGGTAPLSISAIGLHGTKSADFALDYGTCGNSFPIVLNPGGSCSVTAGLKYPATGGIRTTELQITSNDSSHPITSIPVNGWVQSQTPLVPAVSTLLGNQPKALIADPSTTGTVYVAMYRYNNNGPPYYNGSGVYKSTDGGNTWAQMKAGIVLDGGIGDPYTYTLAMYPNNSQSLLVSTGTGVYRTLNGGDTWTLINSLATGISTFAFAPSSPTTIYGANSSYLYQSTDSGATWSNIGTIPSSSTSLVVDPASSTTLYAGTSSGVYKTTNSGQTWLPVNSGLASTYIYDLKSISNTLYAATSYGLYKSTDGAASWVNTPVNGNSSIQGVAVDPTSSLIFYVSSYNSIYKTTDGGATWNPLVDSQGIGSNISYLAVSPLDSKIYAATTRSVYTSPGYTYYTDIYKFSTTTAPPPIYNLNILRNGTGSGSVQYSGYSYYNSFSLIPLTTCNGTGLCGGSFLGFANITINATADPGSVFAGWIGCGTTLTNKCEISTPASLPASQTVTAIFNLDPKPLVALASPPGGTYEAPLEVSLASSKPASIYYTLDGTTPHAASAKYSGAVIIPAGRTTTLTYIAIDSFGTETAPKEESYTVLATGMKILSVQAVGSGSGQVSSDSGGVSCSKGGVGVCSGIYADSSPVTLTVTTFPGSSFIGWSGACSGLAPCILAMTESKSVTAEFGLGPKARISATGYASVSDAYNAAGTDATILAVDGDHAIGTLVLDQGKDVTLKGGYDSQINLTTGQPSLLQGYLFIRSGRLAVQGVKIK